MRLMMRSRASSAAHASGSPEPRGRATTMAATDLASLLDSAVAEAKRAGHGLATPAHLLEALAGRDRARFEHEAGTAGLTALAARLRALPRTFKPVAVAEDLSALLEDCRRQPLPLE